jgi:hypothetical protein
MIAPFLHQGQSEGIVGLRRHWAFAFGKIVPVSTKRGKVPAQIEAVALAQL